MHDRGTAAGGSSHPSRAAVLRSCIRNVGIRNVGTRNVGTRNVGIRNVGTRNVGGRDVVHLSPGRAPELRDPEPNSGRTGISADGNNSPVTRRSS
ncbi:hypothetical protein [Microbacterium sp. CH1]|uniref:hypothetical protein n=1 Tax=Microbacterium sp. CH1 TaxID=1770208 RepID=UPI0009ED356F